jgi:hypothetical protein
LYGANSLSPSKQPLIDLHCLRHADHGQAVAFGLGLRQPQVSEEMIERFYARHLHGEMVVGKIHSSVV